jgi:UrcA family protein
MGTCASLTKNVTDLEQARTVVVRKVVGVWVTTLAQAGPMRKDQLVINRMNIAVGGLSVVCAALAVGTATRALSQPGSQAPVTVVAQKDGSLTERVPYGDLTLTSEEGRHLLMHRVNLAVGRVCPDFYADGQPNNDPQLCKDFAWRGARPQIKRALDEALAGGTTTMSLAIVAAPASK